MANEGSTKPTYSEIEAELLRVRGLLQRQWISVSERWPEIYDSAHGDWRESEIVLLWWASGDYAAGRLCEDEQGTRWWLAGNIDAAPSSVSHWQPIAPPTFPQSSSLVPQGAESADIGKLDTADEWKRGVDFVLDETLDNLDKMRDRLNKEFGLEGSAETGGEKARCKSCGCEFWNAAGQGIMACTSCGARRVTPEREAKLRKQFANEEGDGSTFRQSPSLTEPGPESREPEKLNNVHKHVFHIEGESGEYWYECECGETKVWPDVALAESSLSYPPPEMCMWCGYSYGHNKACPEIIKAKGEAPISPVLQSTPLIPNQGKSGDGNSVCAKCGGAYLLKLHHPPNVFEGRREKGAEFDHKFEYPAASLELLPTQLPKEKSE